MSSTPRIKRVEIPDGPVGTAITIQKMHDLVELGKTDYGIIRLGKFITHRAPAHQHFTEMQQLHDWIQTNIRWVRDPHGVELVISPQRLLDPDQVAQTLPELLAQIRRETPSGDCDDHAVLLCSLAEALGFPTAFCSTGTNPAYPHAWTHVYSLVRVPGHGWVASDTTDRIPHPLGWEAPNGQNPRVWRKGGQVNVGSLQQLPLDLETALLELDEDIRDLEQRPPMELEDLTMGLSVGDLARVGQMGLVTQEDVEEAPSIGMGQLTAAEKRQVVMLKAQIRRFARRPLLVARFRRLLAKLEARSRARATAKQKKSIAVAKAAAKPELSLGPVSKAAAKLLPWATIRRKAIAKAKTLEARKEIVVRNTVAAASTAASKAAVAKAQGQPVVAKALEKKAKELQAQATNLQRAKIRTDFIVRKEIENARIMKALATGSKGVAEYGMERFIEGKGTASGVYREALVREFMGPFRTQ